MTPDALGRGLKHTQQDDNHTQRGPLIPSGNSLSCSFSLPHNDIAAPSITALYTRNVHLINYISG